jgi:hypothetical protein
VPEEKGKRKSVVGGFYTTLNLETERDYHHYLTPLTFEPGGGVVWTLLYTYVNSQVPHP